MSNRADRAAEAARLRAQGLVYREIAERMGISRSYAAALICDPDGSGDRARKDSYRGECERCGASTNGSNGRHAPKLCNDCFQTRYAERNETLIEMWEAGVPVSRIAATLGMTHTAVRRWVDDARHRNVAALSLRRRRTTTHQEKLAVIAAWEAGESTRSIAERFGFASVASLYTQVQRWRRQGYDIPRRQPGRVAVS